MLPLRLVIKETMVGWCHGADVPVDLTRVPVTDLDGRRANALRTALREIERAVTAVSDAAFADRAAIRSVPREYHDWHDRATEAIDDALMLAAAAAGIIADGLGTADEAAQLVRRQPITGRVWRILRGAISACAIRQWDGMEQMVIQTEALAADLRGMLAVAPTGLHRSDSSERPATAVVVAVPAGVMTVQQVAEHLGLSVRTVQDYRLDGRLPDPARMVGRTPIWTREQIDEWQAARPGPGRWGPR